MTDVCKHGQQARVCETCALEEELRHLKEVILPRWKVAELEWDKERDELNALIESLQNKLASRPLSVEDTDALERENDRLAARVAKLREYAWHKPECQFLQDTLPCTCGLVECLQSADGGKQE